VTATRAHIHWITLGERDPVGVGVGGILGGGCAVIVLVATTGLNVSSDGSPRRYAARRLLGEEGVGL
jgi:hypothetical protein